MLLRLLLLFFSLASSLSAASAGAVSLLSALPASVRINPVSGKIVEDRPDLYAMEPMPGLLKKNGVFDGTTVRLSAGRNMHTAFQAVFEKKADTLRGIKVRMDRFRKGKDSLGWTPEIYLEWYSHIKTPSTGYEKSSLGPGWFPDCLIPLTPMGYQYKEAYQAPGRSRWRRDIYLELPDFRNRVPDQKFLTLYIEQYVPFEKAQAPPGRYTSTFTLTADADTLRLPVELVVRNFALPMRGTLLPNFQHSLPFEADSAVTLEIYQHFKRHRITLVDESGYRPDFRREGDSVYFDWTGYDRKLGPYLSGKAFTEKFGYEGPGEGQAMEYLMLPFNTGDSRRGWYAAADPKMEMTEEYRRFYSAAMVKIRAHILTLVDTAKTTLIAFLNGLDESYSDEASDRLLFYGKIFKESFPEAQFRIDGSYSAGTMEKLKSVVDIWCCHSIGYNIEKVREFRSKGIVDWFYGPLLYEQWKNAWCGSISFMDLELNHDRAASWIAYKYGATTWCSWGAFKGWKSAWYDPETYKDYHNEETGKGEGPSLRLYNGNAQEIYARDVVYPLDRPAPPLRLKAMRDGIEEYDCLRLLTNLPGGKETAVKMADEIIYAPLGKKSVGNLNVWNHNPEAWDRARGRLGFLIDSLSSLSRKR